MEGNRYVSASVSENGTLVYASGGSLNPPQLTWFDRAGKPLGTLGEGRMDANLSLSPDERQVAVALRRASPENLDIWTIDAAPNLPSASRVTTDPQPEGWPVWSPKGTEIVFGIGAMGQGGLPEKARLVSDSGQPKRAEGNSPRSRRDTFAALWRATMRAHADRLVRRRTFRVVHVRRDVSGDIGHLGPSALWGSQTASSYTD